MKYFNEELETQFTNLFSNCKHSDAKTEVIKMIPDFLDQIAIINNYDWTVDQRDGEDFSKFVIPGELSCLIAPKRVVLISSNGARDFLVRDEFAERVADRKITLWKAKDFINFTDAFYIALGIKADGVSEVAKARAEVTFQDAVYLKYGIMKGDVGYANDNGYTTFPFVLSIGAYKDVKYCEDINEVRKEFIGITLKTELGLNKNKTK